MLETVGYTIYCILGSKRLLKHYILWYNLSNEIEEIYVHRKGRMKMKVEKRNKSLVDFDASKIKRAIEKAMAETIDGVDSVLSEEIAHKIEVAFEKEKDIIHIEQIQDMVEMLLMDSIRKDVAKRYIIYRAERDRARINKKEEDSHLSEEFISQYKHSIAPMGELGSFVFYRTYSRFMNNEGRREYWHETVKRAVEYNTSIAPTTKEEAEQLYDNVFNLRQFLSGRTFWIGNTDVSRNYPLANFNCAFEVIDSFKSFKDLFYLLMLGCGVGVRVLDEDVAGMSKVRTDYNIIHQDYTPKPRMERMENTSLNFFADDSCEIVVGDSKEGWIESLSFYFELITEHNYRGIKNIFIDYSNVREKGERLRKFGGTASGHESLKSMFRKIDRVIKKRALSISQKKVRLTSVDCMDIANIIGENVVVGGVRRTAEMVIIDQNDKEAINAKSELYTFENNKWQINQDIAHRQMSNNSIYFTSKPSRKELHLQLERMRYSGEPGFINHDAASKRRDNMKGVNPCGEILLDSKGVCNLTTVNVMAFVQDGKLDREGLLKAQRLSARAGYRMTMLELELPEWDKTQKRDRLLGCSLTGWQDMVNQLKLSKADEAELLRDMRQAAREAADEYARELGQNAPLLVTTVKPEGTLSQLPTVSSGVHYSHSPYFVRRVRISSSDPLLKVCEELGYPVFPEVGQDMETASTKVVEFPVKAPEGRTKFDVTAVEQLENYLMFMENYVDHNCSITVHVRENEWEEVEEYVWKHWDKIVAVSFIPLNDAFYELLPYEAITEQEYHDRKAAMKPFIPSLISKYETREEEYELENDGCESGICPVR